MVHRFVDAAAQEAKKSPMDKKHGAVLVRNGKVISVGHNRYRNKAMTTVRDTDSVSMARLKKRFRKYCRRTHHPPPTFFQFCRLTGRLAASIHAEEDAISKAGPLAHGSVLYVVRFAKTQDIPALSCPCKRCSKLCEKNKMKVFYTMQG